MEMLKGVPNKERFDEESLRIHASIARAGDTPLEQKANANEIFRCCFHKWSEKEDDSLWAIHAELIVMRYHELKRHRNEDRMKEVTPDGQLREFFNLEDWQDLQYEFECKMNSPTIMRNPVFHSQTLTLAAAPPPTPFPQLENQINDFTQFNQPSAAFDHFQPSELFGFRSDTRSGELSSIIPESCLNSNSTNSSAASKQVDDVSIAKSYGTNGDENVKWHQTNDVAERKGQLVSLPERGTILEAASHLLMVHDWPVNCPRFMEALRLVGLDCVSQMRYLRMDHHLLTALVERWSPQTNSFHLTVGEMTITLQDVAMILGVNIDGPALVGHTVVGAGRRWLSWPDCCDDLLGSHPLADVVYRDPFDHRITSRFRMGQAHAQTCIPLRWLRWTFWRDSYLDLNDMDFWRHVRAYILFILGCHLLPDTSGSEIHLQYLTIMEDLAVFSTYSLGGAVLAHLYRELGEATRPSRANIAGCINLLQIWAWEHLHVGRPLLRVPFPVELDGLSVGFRWNEDRLRELPVGNLITYRDELDGLLESQVIWQPYTPDIQAQVAQICLSGADIWTARVPLISWKRVEWHLPDRVLRQFGLCPRTDIQPISNQWIQASNG
ncbi:hypothetical protein KFK09_014533 [Dendrobium nobile]|uniref:Aminotransferase-like plant mobile domain-containing protein n=1 Tax=Dendrobium nobile TaxID=94219 RepID=A0A8T3B462_DENNO|nr:hypothetical protein KFK09_014533 [Dendrobium nobile]